MKDTCVGPICNEAKDIHLRKGTKGRKILVNNKATTFKKRTDENVTSTCSVDTKQEMIHRDDKTKDTARKSSSKKPIGFLPQANSSRRSKSRRRSSRRNNNNKKWQQILEDVKNQKKF